MNNTVDHIRYHNYLIQDFTYKSAKGVIVCKRYIRVVKAWSAQ